MLLQQWGIGIDCLFCKWFLDRKTRWSFSWCNSQPAMQTRRLEFDGWGFSLEESSPVSLYNLLITAENWVVASRCRHLVDSWWWESNRDIYRCLKSRFQIWIQVILFDNMTMYKVRRGHWLLNCQHVKHFLSYKIFFRYFVFDKLTVLKMLVVTKHDLKYVSLCFWYFVCTLCKAKH